MKKCPNQLCTYQYLELGLGLAKIETNALLSRIAILVVSTVLNSTCRAMVQTFFQGGWIGCKNRVLTFSPTEQTLFREVWQSSGLKHEEFGSKEIGSHMWAVSESMGPFVYQRQAEEESGEKSLTWVRTNIKDWAHTKGTWLHLPLTMEQYMYRGIDRKHRAINQQLVDPNSWVWHLQR